MEKSKQNQNKMFPAGSHLRYRYETPIFSFFYTDLFVLSPLIVVVYKQNTTIDRWVLIHKVLSNKRLYLDQMQGVEETEVVFKTGRPCQPDGHLGPWTFVIYFGFSVDQ